MALRVPEGQKTTTVTSVRAACRQVWNEWQVRRAENCRRRAAMFQQELRQTPPEKCKWRRGWAETERSSTGRFWWIKVQRSQRGAFKHFPQAINKSFFSISWKPLIPKIVVQKLNNAILYSGDRRDFLWKHTLSFYEPHVHLWSGVPKVIFLSFILKQRWVWPFGESTSTQLPTTLCEPLVGDTGTSSAPSSPQ